MTKNIDLATFEVTYWDELGNEKETILVRPISLSKLNELSLLQSQLLKHYAKAQGSLGVLLTEKAVINLIHKLAAMLPVIGKKEPGFEIDSLLEMGDLIQIGRIFFSESINREMRSLGMTDDGYYDFPEHRVYPKPSAIARIHDLPFFETYQEMIKEEQEAKLALLETPTAKPKS